MEKEENVYGNNTQTGTVAKASGAVAQEREASTVLGKFKDVNALARAYGALEAEFTRRSQRLKELENQLASNSQEGNDAAAAGAEKLRKHAKARKEATKAFDEFVALVGKAHTDSVACEGEFGGDTALEEPMKNSEIKTLETQALDAENEAKEGGVYALKEENTLAATPEGEGNAAEHKMETAADLCLNGEEAVGEEVVLKGEKVFSAVAKNENTEVSSEELYRRVSRDEGVRLKIIGEYLASIGKSGAPLTAAGAGVPISPPLKAKNILDAGVMALQYFKQSY
jgi:hypothetical protein